MNFDGIKMALVFVFFAFIILLILNLFLSAILGARKRKKAFIAIRRVFMILVIPASVASVVLVLLSAAKLIGYSLWSETFGEEAVCYALASLAYLSVFAMITAKMKTVGKTVIAAVGSVLFTAEVFLINNF